MGFVEIELIVEVCGISDFFGDRGVANLIFEGLFETGTPGPARLGRNKRIKDLLIKNRTKTVVTLLLFWFEFLSISL